MWFTKKKKLARKEREDAFNETMNKHMETLVLSKKTKNKLNEILAEIHDRKHSHGNR